MADTILHTYELICPDPQCFEEFTVERSPADLSDGGELIQCPACQESWEWDYDEATDTLELFDSAEFDEDQEDEELFDSADENEEEDEPA